MSVLEFMELIKELTAFTLDAPGKWAVLRGGVPILGTGLNDAMLDYAMTIKEPIALHPTPRDWLRAGGAGLCVLNWSAPLSATFDGLPVSCDPAIARRLRAKIVDEALATLDIREVQHDLAA